MSKAKRNLLSLCVALSLAGVAPLASAADAAAAVDPATTQAIDAAKAAVKQAAAVDGVWRDTEKMIEKAEEAAKAGDNAKAQKLAAEAQKQAELGTNQAYIEKTKMLLASAKADKKMAKKKADAISAAEQALAAKEGKKAYDAISAN